MASQGFSGSEEATKSVVVGAGEIIVVGDFGWVVGTVVD